MLVYSSNKKDFSEDVANNEIANKVLEAYKNKTGRSVAQSEINSWENSLQKMCFVLQAEEIPQDAGILIEYILPLMSKRIDFIVTGKANDGSESAVIIELKQWQHVQVTQKDAVVLTFINGTERETTHPSYQAWSYAFTLEHNFETIQKENIKLRPCAYLHNCSDELHIRGDFYSHHLENAPVFLKQDRQLLTDFIKQSIVHGDSNNIMQRIDGGKIRPSKHLADMLKNLLKGKPEFVMIDDQKLVYEQALDVAKRLHPKQKHVLIVEGGPGTGKTVLAMNLLVALTGKNLTTRYVTKNAAPRAVYESKLSGVLRKSEISNLFVGSGGFIDTEQGKFDVLIVDEAHRLNEKGGLYGNLGENQIKELINAAKFTIFFIDENQRVTLKDIGRKESIIDWANHFNAQVHENQLVSQFRCNGSEGYIAWLDNALQIHETANININELEYDFDFQVFDSPNELRNLIIEKNVVSNKARLVAGYCWDWLSKNNPLMYDINIPDHDFKMRWNLASDGSLWIISPESVSEAGCIHTCQGLELDYVGVIIGPDLIVRNGQVFTDPSKRSKNDNSIRGYKSMSRENPDETLLLTDLIIKNTYRTLMTRGMKGCYIYSEDKETRDFFQQRV
jgi:uncharacterized protein